MERNAKVLRIEKSQAVIRVFYDASSFDFTIPLSSLNVELKAGDNIILIDGPDGRTIIRGTNPGEVPK